MIRKKHATVAEDSLCAAEALEIDGTLRSNECSSSQALHNELQILNGEAGASQNVDDYLVTEAFEQNAHTLCHS